MVVQSTSEVARISARVAMVKEEGVCLNFGTTLRTNHHSSGEDIPLNNFVTISNRSIDFSHPPRIISIMTLVLNNTDCKMDRYHVYDKEGKALSRYVLLPNNDLLDIDSYDLDDEWVEWTPIADTEYEINQEREVRIIDNHQDGYVWIRVGRKLWSISLLYREEFTYAKHKSVCTGGQSCCISCGTLWKIYDEHQGKCWPCLLAEKISGLTKTCIRKMGFCIESDKCLSCFKRSFAMSEKSLFWSQDNECNPCSLALNKNGYKAWFDCPDCHHCFDMLLGNVVKNKWCRYCAHQDLCTEVSCNFCFNNSFASHPSSKYWATSNKVTPRQVFSHARATYDFDCPDCKHFITISLDNISGKGRWCGYCSGRNLCGDLSCQFCTPRSMASHPYGKYWASKNLLPSHQVALGDDKKYWFDCPDCKICFDISPNMITSKLSWCRHCKCKSERKLLKWLRSVFGDESVTDQVCFDWCRNPQTRHPARFDAYLKSANTLIELDGPQHFLQVSNWTAPEKTQAVDIYKMKCANEQGIAIVRLLQDDVLHDRYDWRSKLLTVLQDPNRALRTLLDNGSNIYQKVGYDQAAK
jgi:hypothetical protein